MKNRKGFTLIELVFTMVIIATLAAVVMVAMGGHIANANEKATIRSIEQIYEAAVAWASTQTPVCYQTGPAAATPNAPVSPAALVAGGFLRAGAVNAAGTINNAFGGTINIAPAAAPNECKQVLITVTGIPAISGARLLQLYAQKADVAAYAGDTLTVTY